MTIDATISDKNSLTYFRPAKVVYASASGPLDTSAADAWRKLRAWMKSHGLKIEDVALGFGLLHHGGGEAPIRFDACIDMEYQGDPPDKRLPVAAMTGGVYIASDPLDSHTKLTEASYSVERDPLVGHDLTIDYKRPAIVTYRLDATAAWELTLNRPIRLHDGLAA